MRIQSTPIHIDLNSRENKLLAAGLNIEREPEHIFGHRELYEADSANLDFNSEKLAIVVPIQDEISNGYFFDLLSDLLKQDSIETEDYKAFFLVNNSTQDRDKKSYAYTQNKELVQILDYISGKNPKPPRLLKPWQYQVIEDAKAKKVKLSYIHLNLDRAQYPGLDPIEFSRSFGMNFVKNALDKQNKSEQVLLTSFDADSRLDSDLLSSMLVPFDGKEEPDQLHFDFDDVTVSGPKGLFATSHLARFRGLRKNILDCFATTYCNWKVHRASKYESYNPLRANAAKHRFNIVGDKRRLLPGMKIFAVDRAHGEGGDFGKARLHEVQNPDERKNEFDHPMKELELMKNALMFNPVGEKLDFAVDDIRSKLYAPNETFSNTVLTAKEYTDEIERIMMSFVETSEKEKMELEADITATITQEKQKHDLIRESFFEIFVEASKLHRPLKDSDIDFFFEKGSRKNFYLKENKWLIELINDAISKFDKAVNAWDNLVETLPEYLKDFDDTELAFTNARILAMRNFASKARSTPELYPAFNLSI